MKSAWPQVRLAQVLEEVARPERVSRDRKYRLLGMRWYAKGLFPKDELPGSEIKAANLYRVEPGDFVYNRLFAWKGSFGLAGDEVAGTHVSNEFPCFRVTSDKLLPEFLRWFFSQKPIWDKVTVVSTGSSSQSRLRLKQERFLQLEIPLPPTAEQKNLAALLTSVESRLLAVGKLADKLRDEQDEFLVSRARELAADAPREPMQAVAPLCRRAVPVSKNAEYPEIGVRSFGRGTFQKPTLQGSQLTWQKLYQVKAGDILFSNIKAWEGAVAVIQPEDDGRVGSHRYLTCVPIPQKATPDFLCQWFLTEEGLRSLGGASPGATDRNRTLGMDKLTSIRVPLPPLAKQQEFSSLRRQILTAKSLNKDLPGELDALQAALLDQAFKGEL